MLVVRNDLKMGKGKIASQCRFVPVCLSTGLIPYIDVYLFSGAQDITWEQLVTAMHEKGDVLVLMSTTQTCCGCWCVSRHCLGVNIHICQCHNYKNLKMCFV